MKSSIVYRYAEDAYLLGWENRRVGLFIERDTAARVAAALDRFDRAGWTIHIHPDCDGADLSNGTIRYFLAPLAIPAYVGALLA